MTLRPLACKSATTEASLSKTSISYTCASTDVSTGGSESCHCQVSPTVGRHQVWEVEKLENKQSSIELGFHVIGIAASFRRVLQSAHLQATRFGRDLIRRLCEDQ